MSSYESDDLDSTSDIDAIIIDRDDVSDFNPEQILPQPAGTISKIRAWLQPTSYDIAGGEYKKHLASHVAGTGTWLTSSNVYQEWLRSSEQGLLWIKGIPGSGKSVMAANLIDELAKANPGCPVLFFFFRQIIDANHEPKALLRDWMDQVLIYSPPLQKQLKSYVENHRALESMSMEDMWKDLRMAFAGIRGNVFCVADALDEMDRGNDTFLKALGALGQWRPHKVKVLITSRPVPAVEVPLRKTPGLHIRLQENFVDVDISTYVQHTLQHSAIKQSDWKTIIDAVPGRANGLFLYAKLALDAFLEPGANINEVLSRLPADLNYLYTGLLKEHAMRSGVSPPLQHLILQFVTHATRPLRLLELAELIRATSPDGIKRDLKTTKELIRAACGPLLEILADETVSVIHHSFTEYLKGTTRADDTSGYPILQMGPTHAALARACLSYLQGGCLNTIKVESEKDDDDDGDYDSDSDGYSYMRDENPVSKEEVQVRLKHPFYEYAATHWLHHIHRSEVAQYDQTEINTALHEFFGNSRNLKAWLQIKWPGAPKTARRITLLHVAAKAGLVAFTEDLLKDNPVVEARDTLGRTALWWAANEGHGGVIRVLVAAGANPDQDEGVRGLKPLHQAASNNHSQAVKALLEAGVDPLTPKTRENPGRRCGNAARSTGQTPLMYACQNGHLEAVDAFLPFIKDIDTVHRALAWASGSARASVVARILQHPGVDVNAKVRGNTPLYQACGQGDIKTIEILIHAGALASINCDGSGDEFAGIGGGRWYSPGQDNTPKMSCLHQICGLGSSRIDRSRLDSEFIQTAFTLLVQAGANIHQRTSQGSTALHGAVRSPVLTRLLLDAGADANVVDDSGDTPLHKVPSPDCIALLVESGHADVNVIRADGRTPLLCMLAKSSGPSFSKLLEYCPDCNVIDNNGNSALHIAVNDYSVDIDIVKALVKAGANPNLKNADGQTPLHSRRNGITRDSELLDVLLAAGADIDIVDRDGATFLARTVANQPIGFGSDNPHQDLQDLVDRGASVSTVDFSGRSILFRAVKTFEQRDIGRSREPKMTRFDFIRGLGLDIFATDYNGNTLLHELALRPHNHDSWAGPKLIMIWEQLVALGLDMSKQNHAGRTPLHIMCNTDSQARNFKQGDTMPIDFVISKTTDLDSEDLDGVTALHLAVLGNAMYAKRLLDAGANPAVFTHEGLTPLHLAARARESNIVGLLLDSLRSVKVSSNQQGKSSRVEAAQKLEADLLTIAQKPVPGVNARTRVQRGKGVTPLIYACQSGRPETVRLLLEAGAEIDAEVLRSCADFDQENDLWKVPYPVENHQGSGNMAAVKLTSYVRRIERHQQSNRGNRLEVTENDTARLDAIYKVLIQHGADLAHLHSKYRHNEGIYRQDTQQSKSHCYQVAAILEKKDYNSACFLDSWNRHQESLLSKDSRMQEAMVFESFHQILVDESIQNLRGSELVKPGENNHQLFLQFLKRKEYHLVEELARLGANFLPSAGDNQSQTSNIEILVEKGFDSLLDTVGTLQAESALATGTWHAFGDKERSGLWFANRDVSNPQNKGQNPLPFLLQAVRRDLPNMEVVRLLVEKFGVSLDELLYTHEYLGNRYESVPTTSALHQVAQGSSWWQVSQALPYLLKAGADPNLRDYKGRTPLHIALGIGNYPGPFHREAAKILIDSGADVNATTLEGESCLATAQHDVEMIRLLIAHGAIVAADAVFAAIDAKEVEVLEVLLTGADANIRQKKAAESLEGDELRKAKRNRRDKRRRILSYPNGIQPHEEYPLFRAAAKLQMPWNKTPEAYKSLEIGFKMVQILLDHGADPFAKFLSPEEVSSNDESEPHEEEEAGDEEKEDEDMVLEPSVSKAPPGFEECTLLHDLLSDGKLVDNFLQIPNLDVNIRDAKGRTLLLAACSSSLGLDYIIGSLDKKLDQSTCVSLFERLTSLGSKLDARDKAGRNILHCMIGQGSGNDFSRFEKAFTTVVKEAPSLINQKDKDGKTPLHYAVFRGTKRMNTHVASLLLAAGADPLAVTNDGDNMLHLLAENLNSEMLWSFWKVLVQAGADINGRNKLGETPLFEFCRRDTHNDTCFGFLNRHEEQKFEENSVIPLLQEQGADFSATDAKGRGLLHVAAGGDVDRFKDLLALDLDVMLEDNAHQTAIDIAAACGNQEILELFEKKP